MKGLRFLATEINAVKVFLESWKAGNKLTLAELFQTQNAA